MNIIILGPPGSGKTTQAQLLAKTLSLPHLSTGDLFRQISKEPSPLGKKIKKILEKGELVSDREAILLISQELKKKKYRKGVVLDGCPRTLKQARILKLPLEKVFYLKVSDGEGVKRLLLRKRKGESKEVIKKRLAVYHQETEPILDFYRKEGLLVEIDGEQTIEKIHQDILLALDKSG